MGLVRQRGFQPAPETALIGLMPEPTAARGFRRKKLGEQFLHDLESTETAWRVRSDVASAEASGARGTPTFFVGTKRHTGPHDAESLAAELEASRATTPG